MDCNGAKMIDDIIVIDDFIGKTYQDQIEELVAVSTRVKWIYTKDSAYISHDHLARTDESFSHLLLFEDLVESEHWNFFKPLTYSMQDAVGIVAKKIPRVRLNLLLRAYPGDAQWTNPHIDHPNPHYVGLYYLNDSDGPTYIFDQQLSDVPSKNWNESVLTKYVTETEFTVKQAIEPKKGRMVIFNGHRFHAASKPRDNQFRLTLNINWR
jgi:hypothetical protein